MKLKDRVAFITGGSRGIGRAIAIAMTKEGAHIAINYLKEAKAAGEVVKTIRDLGRDILSLQGDVSDSKRVEHMVDEVLNRFGKMDILVNNAGITTYGKEVFDFLELTDELWDLVMGVNLNGTFYTTRAVIKKYMKKEGKGSIINISSWEGLNANANALHYEVSKAAIIRFTRGVATAMARIGIRVNALTPGFILTDHFLGGDNLTDEEKEKEMGGSVPMGRLGRPEEVAAAAVFLASDDARYITGEIMNITGGLWI